MSKYDPLWQYFQKKDEAVLELSFNEIRDVLGFPVDHSFLNHKKELVAYGYRVKKIYLQEKKIVFEKT